MEQHKSLSQLLNSEEIYIVFGGSSLKDFDFNKLNGKPTLGCNKSAEHYNTDCVISIDPTYINTRRDFLRNYDGYVAIARRETMPKNSKPNNQVLNYIEPNWLYWHNKSFPHKISLNAHELYGTNTGHAAVNFAVLHGFKKIHALGLDLNVTGHWHGGYTHSRQDVSMLMVWAMYLDGLKPQLDELGVEMINYNPDSGVHAYEKRTYDDIH